VTPALTPHLAIAHLRELSTDIRAGVVLAADGSRLAGSETLAAAARELLAAAGDATGVEVVTAGAAVFAARSARRAVVVVCGRLALPALVRYDLRAVLADLDGGRPVGPRREAA
jgi:hypothetical protein